MKQKRNVYGITALIWLLILIIDSKRALEGAAAGLDLCIRTVIPSLFPFFVVSVFLTGSLSGNDFRVLSCISSWLNIPETASSVLIPAFLGGYPVGAKCIGDLYRSHQISRNDAQRLLTFCSNAGPSFLFGMVSAYFPDSKMVWMLWLIHLMGAVLTSFCFPHCGCGKPVSKANDTGNNKEDIMFSAVKAMGIVCGWVIVFRMIIGFAQHWFLWMCPPWLQVLIMGILELANGCCQLLLISDIRTRFVLCSCMMAMGGVCVFLQTVSVINGLSIRSYVAGKALQAFFCFLLSCAVTIRNGWVYAAVIPAILVIFRKSKNKCRNPVTHPV